MGYNGSDASKRRTRRGAAISTGAAGLLASFVAWAALTAAWTLSTAGTDNIATATVLGITVQERYPTAIAQVNGTFNATNFWNDPYGGTVAGGPSLQLSIPADLTSRQVTVNFSEPVNNPVLHLDRLGGTIGATTESNSSRWTLAASTVQTGAVSLTRLSGNAQFSVVGSSFQRAAIATGASGSECTATAESTACGSIQFNGTGVTQLVFNVVMTGTVGAGDGMEMAWSFNGSTIRYRKQSVGGTGSFSLSGTNGVGSTTQDTAIANPTAPSAFFTVADHAQSIAITEPTVPANYVLSASSSCVDQNNASVASTVNAGTRTLTIAPTAYNGNQQITCTMVNTRLPTVTVTKVSNGGTGTFAFSGNNGFAAQNITTTSPGTGASGATQALTTPSTATRITEAAPPAGFVLTAISCTGLGAGGTATPTINGSGGGFVDLSAQATAPGSNIACTFTNNALGSITIVKDAQPDNAQDFAFVSAESPLLNFSLDDDADPTLPNSRTIGNLSSGTYTVSESTTPGWTLASITCVDPDGGTTTSLPGRSAVIDLDPGENITCTYVNGATGIADVQITKTNNNTAPLVAGGTTTYVLTVTNNGPAAVNGAVVRDTPGAGLSCPPANPVTCSPAGACPAGTNVGNLTSGSGVTLGNIANGGVVTLTFTCNVQ